MEMGSNSDEKEFTARELAKIMGVTQQTIINRCKAGQFAGAEKRKSPYGEQWFIPESALQIPQEIIPVVKVDKPIPLKDLENTLKAILGPVYAQSQELIEQNEKLQEQIAELNKKIENLESHDHKILTQIKILSEQENKSFWKRLFNR